MNSYDREIIRIKDRRREALDRALIAWQNALRDSDELYAAFTAYQEQMLLSAQCLKNTLDESRQKLRAAIAEAGLDEKQFDPPCACEKCKDTGRVNGRYCRCVIKAVINSDRQSFTLPVTDFKKAKASAPNAAIKKIYGVAEDYIKSYPGGKPFMILTGSPGTGKTVLASAIATSLMDRGASAVSVTAFDFVRRALDYHTQFSIPDYVDRFTPMLDCDVLVIDDLGTESMLKNVTLEYLYTVVNERWLQKKYTVVTTNRTAAELNRRYGESIFSRLCDKSRAYFLSADSKNARI